MQVRSLLNPKTVDKATFKGKCVPKPGGYTAFRSHSNSNMLTHPARGQVSEGRYLDADYLQRLQRVIDPARPQVLPLIHCPRAGWSGRFPIPSQ